MMIPRNAHRKTARRGAQEQGVVLVVAAMIILVMMILALPLLTKLVAQQGTTGRESKTVAALCLAEAGVDKAVLELNGGSWARTESLATPLTMALDDYETPGGAIVGDVDITVRPFNNADKTRVVDATGSVRHRGSSEVAKSVRVILLRREKATPSGEDLYVIASWQEAPRSL